MTAAEALASIREDIDRLEAKGLNLKPGFFRRKRDEADAIANELQDLREQVKRSQQEREEAQAELRDQHLRVGMLANTITILGFPIAQHMNAPLEDADIYHEAAAMVCQQRRDAPQGPNRLPQQTSKAALMDLLTNALWWARLNSYPLQHLIDQAHAKRKERKQAA